MSCTSFKEIECVRWLSSHSSSSFNGCEYSIDSMYLLQGNQISVYPKVSDDSFSAWSIFLFLCWWQETLLLEWVNPIYIDISYQEQIQEEFEENSEIQLKDFFKVSVFPIFSSSLVVHELLLIDVVFIFRRRSSGRWVKHCDSLRFSGRGEVRPTRGGVISLVNTSLRWMMYLNDWIRELSLCVHSDAMKLLIWTPCLSVWANAWSCFAQRPSSCSSPTSPAFTCTSCVPLMMTMRRTTRREGRRRRSKRKQGRQKPRHLQWRLHQRMGTERRVCVRLRWCRPVCTAVLLL